MDLLYLPYWES